MRFVMVAVLLVVAAACGRDSGTAQAGDGVWERPADEDTVEDARDRAERMAMATLDAVSLDGAATLVDADSRRLQPCDPPPVTAETTFTANATVRADTDREREDLLAAFEGYWTEQGVEGLVLGLEQTTTPTLRGTFDRQRWQVGVLVNEDNGFVSVSINTPCLPSTEWDQL